MGVNDLAGMADDERHADMVKEVAREAWHKPRSMGGREPNPSVDGARVVAGTYNDGHWQEIRICFYDEVDGQEWFARIENVLLLPEGEGDE